MENYIDFDSIGFTDDFMFRMHPEDFEKLRSNYQYRREFYVD